MKFPRHLPSSGDVPITTLYVNHWTPPTGERRREIDECLKRNVDCPSIDRIVLLAQSTTEHRADVAPSPKLVWVDLPSGLERARYSDFFLAVNSCTTTPWDLNIVANSDVFFDESLDVLKSCDLFGTCVALSRWELKNGQVDSLAGDYSQDCWIFQGPVRPLAERVDFPLGTYGCDWRIAWILRHNDYTLINVPHDVRQFHIHDSPYRNNGTMTPGQNSPHVPHRRLDECHLPKGRHDRGGVLAFSLWGDHAHYNFGAIENAKLAKWIYPDWTVRVYVDDSTPAATIDALQLAAAEVVPAPGWPNWRGGLFWRLQAIDDPGFVRWGIRDTDSRATYRERQAIESWLDSGLSLHTVRDHPDHRRPVMLCGFDGRRAAIHDMAGHIAAWRQSGHGDQYGSDEEMIQERLWPEVRSETLVHSDFGDLYGHGGVIRPFPTRRPEGLRFIGERIYEDNHHNGDDRDRNVSFRLSAEPARVATREDLIRLIPARAVIAEVGVFRGEFAERILTLCQPAEFHLIDLWSGSTTSGDKDGRNIVAVDNMEAMYHELCARYRDLAHVHLHRGESVEVLSRFPNQSLDAAYLDTSHYYQQTLAELDILMKKIRPGGWLLGHDYFPGCPVWPAVNEWCVKNGQHVTWLTRDDGCPSFAIAVAQH
ncbi:MAG: class I SAM-dependent methyltransferase [Planctomycetes bacterium]|nr:class I SAM-dependent methyltransferase [Planctomycetota bacterium]